MYVCVAVNGKSMRVCMLVQVALRDLYLPFCGSEAEEGRVGGGSVVMDGMGRWVRGSKRGIYSPLSFVV